ncbi:MAG: Fe(3+) ABC transporter substrate-binding protein [Bacteroidota bacterium]
MKKVFFLSLLVAFIFGCNSEPQTSSDQEAKKSEDVQEVNVYSHRHYDIDKEIYAKFQEETGIKVNVIKAKADELLEKIKTEGENSPADLLVTVDAGRIQRAVESGVLDKINRSTLPSGLNEQYIDQNDQWVALTMRARVLAYSNERVNPEDLSTMEALADEQWKGRVLARSSSNIYNQSLMASLIAHDGQEGAIKWAEGMVNNFARTPKGNDRDQVKAIYAGEGDVAIVNTYYIGKLLTSDNPEEVNAGKAVNIFFPNQERGTHINISAAGICKYSPNASNAQKLLEFLLSPEIQGMYSEGNHEYPVIESATLDPILAAWGEFKKDSLSFTRLGQLNTEAVKAFDTAGWN